MIKDDRVNQKKISIVIPVFNEEIGLHHCYQILKNVMDELGYPYEFVISDNGSTDNTEAIAQKIVQSDPRVKYVRLSRNFGYQNNITAGMYMATGDAIVVIDADLQDPPEMIAEFVKYWQEGYDIVYGVREKRTDEPRLRIFMTMIAMRLINWLSDYPLPQHSSDFRLITREVRDVFAQMPEQSRFVRGMIHWVGFQQIGLPYTRGGRQFDKGSRQWGAGFLSLFGFTLDAIFSFSLKPLRVFSLIGVLALLFSFFMFTVYLALRIINPSLPPGFTTQMLFSLVHLGITALGIGILGEYLGRTYMETKQRPLWIVQYTMNFDKTDTGIANQKDDCDEDRVNE